jgi:glycerophosphoryl diester phosphodiesterase
MKLSRARAQLASLQHTLLSADVIAAARRRGLILSPWTVNDGTVMQRMLELGIDSLISGRPDLAKGLSPPMVRSALREAVVSL